MENSNTKPIYPNVQLIVDQTPLSPFEGDFYYFTFNQNNSGGGFDRDDNIGECVIIAAKDAEDANTRAEELGIYFNGCASDRDCPCCGDRWSDVYGEGDELPSVYGDRPEVHIANGNFRDQIIVHHSNGMRETYRRVVEKR